MRKPLGALALLVGVSLAGPAGAGAQIDGFLAAGSGTMHVGSETSYGIVRIAPALGLSTSSLLIAAEGDYAGHTEHGWQTTGRVNAAARHRLPGSLEARLGVEGGWSRTRWGRSGAGWIGEGRIQIGSPLRGFAIAAGSGHSFDHRGSHPLTRMEAGGWSRLGRVDVGFWLKRTGLSVPGSETTDRDPVDTLGAGSGNGRRTLQDHYTDAEATLGWSRGNLSLEAGAGRRFGKAIRFTSWHVRALYQVNSRLALVASSGQYPVDLVSGLPSGGFTTLSMRFNLRSDPFAPLGHFRVRHRAQRSFSTFAHPDGTWQLTVKVPDARTVELMGDFTDWKAVLLVPDDQDLWRLRMRIPAGVHEVNVRVDGGAWAVPSGLTSVSDGLGGAVGVFVVD